METFSGSCEHWERVRKASDGREVSRSFVGWDVVLRAVQPLVLLPQWPTPSAGLGFALPESLECTPSGIPYLSTQHGCGKGSAVSPEKKINYHGVTDRQMKAQNPKWTQIKIKGK